MSHRPLPFFRGPSFSRETPRLPTRPLSLRQVCPRRIRPLVPRSSSTFAQSHPHPSSVPGPRPGLVPSRPPCPDGLPVPLGDPPRSSPLTLVTSHNLDRDTIDTPLTSLCSDVSSSGLRPECYRVHSVLPRLRPPHSLLLFLPRSRSSEIFIDFPSYFCSLSRIWSTYASRPLFFSGPMVPTRTH